MAVHQERTQEETREDMKLTKFTVLVEELQDYFYPMLDGQYGLLAYYPPFIDQYTENAFVRVIREKLMRTPEEFETDGGWGLIVEGNVLSYIKCVVTGSSIYLIRWNFCQNEADGVYSVEAWWDSYCLIFWLLFLAAIDDDLYNNELSAIIDLAYCLKFDEDMIRDWCRAVQYVLEGNHLAKDCDLTCETAAGKQFFLHEEEE